MAKIFALMAKIFAIFFRHFAIFAILAINFLVIFAIMAKMASMAKKVYRNFSPFLLFFSQKSMAKWQWAPIYFIPKIDGEICNEPQLYLWFIDQ